MTQIAVNTSLGWKALLPWVKTLSNVWAPVLNGFAHGASTWDQFFQNFTASASMSSVVGFASTATVTSWSTTVTPSGGASPYTYAWARHSGSTAVTADAPTSAATTFSASLAVGQSADAVFKCTVTDSNGHSVVVAVAVNLHRAV